MAPRFPPEEPTLPGIQGLQDAVNLRRENDRLRAERDAALQALSEVPTIPPPTPRQRLVRAGLTSAQWTLIGSAVAVLVPIIEKKWPMYSDVVTAIATWLGVH